MKPEPPPPFCNALGCWSRASADDGLCDACRKQAASPEINGKRLALAVGIAILLGSILASEPARNNAAPQPARDRVHGHTVTP